MCDFYFDREQSEAKHQILRRYLLPFSNKILSRWHSIDFIDGFSGPWENRDTLNFTDTSIGIALSTLSSVAQNLGHTRQDRKIRCIFNEANANSYALLSNFIDRSRDDYPLIKIETFQGKFETNAVAISKAANHKFQLLFVDPTGYTGFPPSSLSVFSGRSSEVIVNFMRSFIERFVSGAHRDREKHLIGLVGQKRAQFLLDTGVSIESVEAEYLSMLRSDLGYKFAGYSPIHNPDRNEIHFNLAYATNHHAGMEVLRNAEFGALTAHDRKRFERSRPDTGPDLFSGMDDQLEIRGPYLKARQRHLDNAVQTLTDSLPVYPKAVPFGDFAANAQQSLYLKRSELGDAAVKMANRGIIKPTWRDRNGKKPQPKDLICRVGPI